MSGLESPMAICMRLHGEGCLCQAFPVASPEPCSCEEALALRAQLIAATAGTVALHVVKACGFWTIERWRDGALVESYVGAPNIAEALVRIGDWMRATETQGE